MKENIEEVVERLEKSINDVWFSTTYSQEDEERDLQILLSDYKRVLKENEDWQKAYQEEKDKQFELLRENQKLKKELGRVTYGRNQLFEYATAQQANPEMLHKVLRVEYIPKQKVKELLEEVNLPLTIVGGRRNRKTLEYGVKLGRLKALQDLLEEKGE